MLKRHQCCIDLQRNQLAIGTTGEAVPFLPESEIPQRMREARAWRDAAARAVKRSANHESMAKMGGSHRIRMTWRCRRGLL